MQSLRRLAPIFKSYRKRPILAALWMVREVAMDRLQARRIETLIVLQTPFLFSATVIENIRYARLANGDQPAAMDEQGIAADPLASADPNFRDADCNRMMPGGEIVERGSHAERLANTVF